jgi:hypothetical protein
MTVKTLLFILSLGLLVWLFIDSTFQLDIAATKNNGLTSMKKQEVDEMQNIDSVKTYAKSTLDIIRQNTRTNSAISTKRIWLILILLVLQLFLWTKRTRTLKN